MLMNIAKSLQVIRKHGISPCPASHVDHATHEVGSLNRNPLTYTGPDPHQPNKVNRLHVQVVQETDDVLEQLC